MAVGHCWFHNSILPKFHVLRYLPIPWWGIKRGRLKSLIFTAATKLRQGNIFTSVCQEFCPQGGMHGRWACVVGGMCGRGGMHGRGHAWWGACMAGRYAWQEVCMAGGHAWQGGMHGRGACVAGGMCGGGCMGGGMHGRGVCMAGKWQLQWAIRILLECILVCFVFPVSELPGYMKSVKAKLCKYVFAGSRSHRNSPCL